MLVSAAIALGADQEATVGAMLSTKEFLRGCEGLRITVRDVLKHGFRAKQTVVAAREAPRERKGRELLGALRKACSSQGLSPGAGRFAMDALTVLVRVEGRLHGEDADEVHLHEAGSIDTLVDILGTACALDGLGVFSDTRVVATPIAVGGGTFTFSHGTLSSPGPAVLEIAREHRLAIVGGPGQAELTTPTGIAMLASLVDECVGLYPSMTPTATGLGAGAKELPGAPNVLRLTLGETTSPGRTETVAVLETNLDDATGEYLSHASQSMMEAGAMDVIVIPAVGKKGRPGYLLRVLCDRKDARRLAEVVMVETGTLGVRMTQTERVVAERTVVRVPLSLGGRRVSAGVKVSHTPSGRLISVKPEYEEVLALSKRLGVPARHVHQAILAAAARAGLGSEAGASGRAEAPARRELAAPVTPVDVARRGRGSVPGGGALSAPSRDPSRPTNPPRARPPPRRASRSTRRRPPRPDRSLR